MFLVPYMVSDVLFMCVTLFFNVFYFVSKDAEQDEELTKSIVQFFFSMGKEGSWEYLVAINSPLVISIPDLLLLLCPITVPALQGDPVRSVAYTISHSAAPASQFGVVL